MRVRSRSSTGAAPAASSSLASRARGAGHRQGRDLLPPRRGPPRRPVPPTASAISTPPRDGRRSGPCRSASPLDDPAGGAEGGGLRVPGADGRLERVRPARAPAELPIGPCRGSLHSADGDLIRRRARLGGFRGWIVRQVRARAAFAPTRLPPIGAIGEDAEHRSDGTLRRSRTARSPRPLPNRRA